MLPLLALALSLGGPASAADHGLKSVRIEAAQGFDVELLEEYSLAATAHRSKAQAGPLELPRPYRLQKVEQVTLGKRSRWRRARWSTCGGRSASSRARSRAISGPHARASR